MLKSYHKGGGPPEQGFRRCFADGLYQSLVSSVAHATTRTRFDLKFLSRILKKSHLGKRHCRLFTRKVSTVLIEAFSWSQNVKTSKLILVSVTLWKSCPLSHLGKRHCRLFTRKVSTVLIEAFSWSQNVKTSKLILVSVTLWKSCPLSRPRLRI